MDAVTGSPAGDADLALPFGYLVMAPVSNLLDARHPAQPGPGAFAAHHVGAAVRRHRRRAARLAPPAHLARGGGGGYPAHPGRCGCVSPASRAPLVTPESGVTVLDFHSHTAASHDGRHGWSPERVAAWHAAQGFQAAYITDHNVPFDGFDDAVIPLLPGAEWSVYRQHIIQLGVTPRLDLTPYSQDTPGMVSLFAALHAQGAIAIASLPEYWRNHWDDLDLFVAAGVDGFEIATWAPKALEFPTSDTAAR